MTTDKGNQGNRSSTLASAGAGMPANPGEDPRPLSERRRSASSGGRPSPDRPSSASPSELRDPGWATCPRSYPRSPASDDRRSTSTASCVLRRHAGGELSRAGVCWQFLSAPYRERAARLDCSWRRSSAVTSLGSPLLNGIGVDRAKLGSRIPAPPSSAPCVILGLRRTALSAPRNAAPPVKSRAAR